MARYQTSVASFATNLNAIDTDITSNFIQAMCFRPEYPHNRHMLTHLMNGQAANIHRVFNYGQNTYTYGLPDGYAVAQVDKSVEIKAIIEAEVGYEVELLRMVAGYPEYIEFARDYANDHWGWRYTDDWLASSPISTDPGYVAGPPQPPQYHTNTTVYEGRAAGEGKLGINLKYGEMEAPNYGGTFPPPPPIPRLRYYSKTHKFGPIMPDQFYWHVRFKAKDAESDAPLFWFYELGSNLHPDIELDEDEFDSPYLPIVPIRQDNKNLGPEVEDGEYVRDENGDLIVPDTELYRTSKKLCKIAGTDFNELCREITSNPDVGDIDHAFLIFGIDVRPEQTTSKQYIYQFFADLADRFTQEGSIEIKDAKYKVAIQFGNPVSETITGTLEDKTELEYEGNTIICKRRIDDTTYHRVTVPDLYHVNYIFQGYVERTSLEDSADEDNYNFIIPLNYRLSKLDRGMFNRDKLYAESFKLVFNCWDQRKLKWYERGLFKVVIIIVAVVLAIWSGGTSLAAMTSLYASYGIVGVALYLGAMLLVSQLLKFGFRKLVEYLGPEWAAIIGIVAALTSVLYGGGLNVGPIMIDSSMLLSFSSGIIQGIADEMSANLKKLQEELDSFSAEAKALDKELQALEEELQSSTWLDAYEFMGSANLFVPHETPEEYYNRTIHAGNIGVGALAAAEGYVEAKLTLPKLESNLMEK